MKVKHQTDKQIKEGAKLKLGKLKIKSLTRTMKKSKEKNRKKFSKKIVSKHTKINLNSANIDKVQAEPLPDKLDCLSTENIAAQSNCKQRKKRSNKQTTVNESSESSPDIQYPMDDITKWDNDEEQVEEEDNNWKLDLSEEETEKITDEDWAQITIRGQKNTESSYVDILSQNFTSLDLPTTSKYQRRTRLGKNTDMFHNNNTLISSSDEKCVITTGDISSEDSTPSPRAKHQKQASSTSESTDTNNEFANNTLEDANASSSSSMYEEVSLKNSSSRSSLDRDYETCSSPENISVRYQHWELCNHKRPKTYCIKNIVIVVMESESKFCFSGKLLAKVLYGAVKIYGFTLDASNDVVEVYSPRAYSNVAIETSEVFPAGNVENVWKALSTWGITRESESVLQADIDKIQPRMAVIVLENFENNLTLFLNTYFLRPFKLFPNMQSSHYIPWTSPERAEIVLQANLCFAKHRPYREFCKRLTVDPRITTDIAEDMLNRWRAEEWSCTLIAGGKNVGKSTSVRYLINSLLRSSGKVVLIDLDPGQSECTPAGCVSYSLIEKPLMGPNFTHLRTPVYQLFIDELNVARCIMRYLSGVKMLIEKLKTCPVLSRLPIVVNTMGFIQDLGWNLMILVIKLIRPSIVLQIKSVKSRNNFMDALCEDVVNKQKDAEVFCDSTLVDYNEPCKHDFYMIDSKAEFRETRAAMRESHLEPYQQRDLVMMSYLSDIVRDINNSYQYNAISVGHSFSINAVVPYVAPFSSLYIIPQYSVLGVPPSHVLRIINGNIVALCGIDLSEESQRQSENISNLRVLMQKSPLCTCYGFGIIRGVDMERQEVFINTPLPISIMQYVNCLAGCIATPPALLELSQGAPYVGEKATLPTSREPHRKYFRIRHQNRSNKS